MNDLISGKKNIQFKLLVNYREVVFKDICIKTLGAAFGEDYLCC